MKHRYRDKISGRLIELDESKTTFVALASPDDAESIGVMAAHGIFSITPSNNRDGVFILEVSSDAESQVQVEQAIEEIENHDAVDAVTPALLDAEGITRLALPGRILVQFVSDDRAKADTLLAKHDARVARAFRSPGLFEVEVDPDRVFDVIQELNKSKAVRFAEPNYYGVNDQEIRSAVHDRAAGAGDAEGLEDLPWNLTRIAAAQAWATTKGSTDVVVAVVDGWPGLPHPALAGKMLVDPDDELAFTSDRTPSSHATAISGLIAADAGDAAGVAPGARVVPLIVNLRAQSYAERAESIRFAARAAAAGRVLDTPFRRMVLSCSWRVSGDVIVVRAALQEAVAAGVPVVFSAGNESSTGAHYPSDYAADNSELGRGVICVAATDQQDRKAGYSNYSASVDVCAPGGDGLPFDDRDIMCADLNNGYAEAAGTSIAVPHVAAVAALILAVNPALTPAQVKAIIRETADDVSAVNPGLGGMLGTGRINAARAVAAAAAGVDAPQPAPGDAGTPDDPGDPSEPGDVDETAPDNESAAIGGMPSLRIDAVVADETPADDIAAIRELLGPARTEIHDGTGWQLVEARFVRDGDTINTHFD